jgi:cellulose synthase/poly-beta-1,6-N-acetylglucosamine synthase-like glycosyltransferase/peptidoglycan/xylan/chitin deacetylase (PgdA/CDA1 family)/spore germination protein YaaH
MAKPIFYDPQRRRWKRLRLLLDLSGLVATLLLAFFIVSVFRSVSLQGLVLRDQHRPYHALKEKERRRKPRARLERKKRKAEQPQKVEIGSGEGLRAAFYVTWDPASFATVRMYLHQIDVLYPEWLHVLTPDGKLQGLHPDNTLFDVMNGTVVRPVDDKLMPYLKEVSAETEVLPLVNNYDPLANKWANIQPFVMDPGLRAEFRRNILAFLATDSRYKGLTLDFESFPTAAQPGYMALVSELESDLHARGLKLDISVPVRDTDFDYAFLSAHSDALILMNYDEHYQEGDPGPIASQDWFTKNLQDALKTIPRDKLICAIGGYGYDWSTVTDKRGRRKVASAKAVSVQEAWLDAADSESDIDFDSDSLNPHFAYVDDDNHVRHDIWYLDGATALNEMRAAVRLGINQFALWRLGSEDRSLWAVFDTPGKVGSSQQLRLVPPGLNVDMEGAGEIIRVGARPANGERSFDIDVGTGLITGEQMKVMPTPYKLDQYGAAAKQIAISFDDGPDPAWTPQILDILKREHAPASFFVVGSMAEKYPDLLQREYREGHEIGNHTWTHPDISNIRERFMKVELNLPERLFASKLGVKSLLFRPPYSIDQEPDTSDQVRPLEISQGLGYITIGDKIDPNDWKPDPRPTPQQIVNSVVDQLPPCDSGDRCGNIVLLHDGGGDRSATVAALPMIIETLRAKGYEIVPIAQLIGKAKADVMPPITASERWSASLNNFGFLLIRGSREAIVIVFFLGDVLMSGRLFIIGALAIFDRFRRRKRTRAGEGSATFQPAVAVLIPAYNEEKVIERTVRAVLDSDYPRLRVIVIDDGSKDHTLEVAQRAFGNHPRVTVLTKPNSGKAEALNYALEFVTEEIFVGIDADTVIAPDAITRLVPHFLDSRIGAIAGNAKVGNRVNLWTRWQALEYVTSQNFERRALNVLGAVSVVPGAIGAWRTAAVREAGGYHVDTVAEDADLTMALLQRGYRVEYEDRALAFTEAPFNARGLMRQRFRWSFGILQAVVKHRHSMTRRSRLGWVALPNIIIFQILLPLVSPFIDLMFAFGALSYGVDRYFHPDTADPRSFEKLVVFFLTFMIIDFVASAVAFALERRTADNREDPRLLLHVTLQRFAYRQLFSVVLFKTLYRALTGHAFNWDKLERTAQMTYAKAGS